MSTDLVILALYIVVAICSKAERRVTSYLVVSWFVLSVFVASLELHAVPTFPIYWGMAAIMCILLSIRGSAMVVWGMASMFLLQLAMTADALITNEPTALYLNYYKLSLLINVVIIFLTFLHGRGAESDYRDFSLDPLGHSDRTRS